MKAEDYNYIVDRMCKQCFKQSVIHELAKQFPETNKGTIYSIYTQEYQRMLKQVFALYRNRGNKIKLYEQYRGMLNRRETQSENSSLLVLADQINYGISYAPSMIARDVLETNLRELNRTATREKIGHLLSDTSLIDDVQLSVNVDVGKYADIVCGPIMDGAKSAIGQDYEIKLHILARKHNLHYYNEDELKVRGYDKTPDLKLCVPVAINGKVVNWIESKALFGDEKSHKEYFKTQFSSYWNRFGPGLVIYWSGYIDELENDHPGIMLADHFPTDFTYMNPAFVDTTGLMDKNYMSSCNGAISNLQRRKQNKPEQPFVFSTEKKTILNYIKPSATVPVCDSTTSVYTSNWTTTLSSKTSIPRTNADEYESDLSYSSTATFSLASNPDSLKPQN